MNDIRFTKTNGGMVRTTASEDPISALIMPLRDADVIAPAHEFTEIIEDELWIAKFQYAEQLKEMGLEYEELVTKVRTAAAVDQTTATGYANNYKNSSAINALVYHVSEFFRMNPNGTLYVGITFDGSDIPASYITDIQKFANGKIRQVGILTPSLTNLAGYQTEATSLERDHMPLSIVVAPSGFTHTVTGTAASSANTDGEYVNTVTVTAEAEDDLKKNTLKAAANTMVANGKFNVSVLIGCDRDQALGDKLGTYEYYGCIGTCLGAISKAAVNECIAWVQKFPLGLKEPGLISGEKINTVSTADQNDLNANHLIFVRTHVGVTDCYFNDSWTLDLDTSDYAYIENVRTIDKACRGVRAKLLPYLNSPLKVDAETGKLAQSTVAFLQTTAGRALEDMEKADEHSGYVVEIDPEQNVISTSMLQVVIKQVPTGVMRNVNIKIGYTTSIS